MRARSPAPGMMHQNSGSQSSQYRAASPNPHARQSRGPPNQASRQGSGMEMQLSSQDVTRYDGSGSGRKRQNMRPTSSFGGDRYQQPPGQGYDNGRDARGRGSVEIELRRERSKSLANIPFRPAPQQQAPLYFGKAPFPSPNPIWMNSSTLTNDTSQHAQCIHIQPRYQKNSVSAKATSSPS
jgi:hypothetical protein